MNQKEFDEENVQIEFEAETKEKVETIKENRDWEAPYYEIETEEGSEYIVLEDEDKAIELAEGRVKQDLEDEPELFNQNWLKGCMNDKISGKSFIEHATEEAVQTDGFAHFLATYDGDYQETESGFIIMRVN